MAMMQPKFARTTRAMYLAVVPLKWIEYGVEVLGLYKDNGKENGNDYILIGYMLGL